MINLHSFILLLALNFLLYFQIEQSRAITLFTFSKISQEKKLKNRTKFFYEKNLSVKIINIINVCLSIKKKQNGR